VAKFVLSFTKKMAINNTTVYRDFKVHALPTPAPKTGKTFIYRNISRLLREQIKIAISVMILCKDSTDQNPECICFYDCPWKFSLN